MKSRNPFSNKNSDFWKPFGRFDPMVSFITLGPANPIKEFGLALSIIKPEECSLPINTSFGFHLLWLEKIRPGGKPNLKDHWPKIEAMSLNNKKMTWYENWIKKEKEKFYIEILN